MISGQRTKWPRNHVYFYVQSNRTMALVTVPRVCKKQNIVITCT
jgi:hypothetical protein